MLTKSKKQKFSDDLLEDDNFSITSVLVASSYMLLPSKSPIIPQDIIKADNVPKIIRQIIVKSRTDDEKRYYILMLSIMEHESNLNNLAVNWDNKTVTNNKEMMKIALTSKELLGAYGYFQFRKTTIKEINRVYNTNYTIHDALNKNTSISMYAKYYNILIQQGKIKNVTPEKIARSWYQGAGVNFDKNLWKKADNYWNSVESIAIENSEQLLGRNLFPNSKIDYKTTYIVKNGDTLSEIAQKCNTTVELLKQKNPNLTSKIFAGQKIQLPQKNDIVKKQSNVVIKKQPIITSKDVYVVQKGDSLWKIAKEHNTTVEELYAINNLKNGMIFKGQKIVVRKEYTAKKGDSLWKIAKEHNTTVEKLKELNKLKSDDIYEGQKLLIK